MALLCPVPRMTDEFDRMWLVDILLSFSFLVCSSLKMIIFSLGHGGVLKLVHVREHLNAKYSYKYSW
jgi:hypothetical protein